MSPVPLIDIEDVRVPFPHHVNPYPQQLVYMAKLLEALKLGQDALLESPTGTGKTICLLATSIAFRDAFRRSVVYIEGIADKVAAKGHEERIPDLELFISSVPQLRDFYKLHAWPTIRATTKAHVFTDEAKGKAIRKAEDTMLTTSLSPGAANTSPPIPRIIYTSRTHGQLAQSLEVARKLTEDRGLVTVTLASKHHTCVTPEVRSRSAKTHTSIDLICKQSRATGRCRCKDVTKEESVMEYLRSVCDKVPTLSTFIAACERRAACPYYAAKGLLSRATGPALVMAPYNYVISPKKFGLLKLLEDSILIFDEGHNVSHVVEDELSVSLHIRDLVVSSDALALPGATPQGSKSGLDEALRTIAYLEAAAGMLTSRPDTPADPRVVFSSVFHSLDSAEVGLAVISFASDFYAGAMGERDRDIAASLGRLNDFVSTIITAFMANALDACVVTAVPQASRDALDNTKLDFRCLTAAPIMQGLHTQQRVRSVIITSGTLKPLDSISNELGLPFPVRHEGDHVIEPFQLFASVVPSYHGVKMSSAYTNRSNESYKGMVGVLLDDVCQAVSGGVIAFFPSSGVLSSVVSHWKTANGGMVYRTLMSRRQVFIAADGDDDSILEKLRSPEAQGAKETLLLAVCRGRFSEGIDYPGRMARCVVVVGVPFPPAKDPAVMLHREFADRMVKERKGIHPISGNEWYAIQAARAVNQCVGRAIRHINDFGSVLLVDERYASPGQLSRLPRWVQMSLAGYESGKGSLVDKLRGFFKDVQEAIAVRMGVSGRAAHGKQMLGTGFSSVVDGNGIQGGVRVSVTTKLNSSLVKPSLEVSLAKQRASPVTSPSCSPQKSPDREKKKEMLVELFQRARKILTKPEYSEMKHVILLVCNSPKNENTPLLMGDYGERLLGVILPDSECHNVERKAILRDLCSVLPPDLANPIRFKTV